MNHTFTFEEILEKTGSLTYTNVGISMRPLIREGKDAIHMKRADGEIKKYDVVLFTRPRVSGRGHYILHRVIKIHQDGTYWIVGDNCINGETVRRDQIIGVVDAVFRNGKTVRPTDVSYRLYVALWCAPYPVRFLAIRMFRFAKRVRHKLHSVFFRR